MSPNWLEQFYNAKHHHRGQAHKRERKRRQDDRRRTARTGLALCDRVILDSVVWHTGGSRQGHPRYTSAFTEGGRGWPETRFTRHHQNDKTKVTAPRLCHEHGSGAGLLKPQIYEAATDKTRSRVHHRSRKDQTESLHQDSEVEDCRGTASAIGADSRDTVTDRKSAINEQICHRREIVSEDLSSKNEQRSWKFTPVHKRNVFQNESWNRS